MNNQFALPECEQNQIANVIAVMSGKGGVGKSSVTSMLASSLAKQGFKVGILDADITGPSIPKMFGLTERAEMLDGKLIPRTVDLGIKIMSINILLEDENQPVIWRGPVIAGTVKQFWTHVVWGELDYLIIDLPPGTGDVPLTVLQSFPVDGVVIVSSPQDLAVMVVKKALNMTKEIGTPILGFVENMSYLECPGCNKRMAIFGESKIDEVAEQTGIPVIGILPLDPETAKLGDQGRITEYQTEIFKGIPAQIEQLKYDLLNRAYKIAIPEENGEVNQHFGQCTTFAIVSIAHQEVKNIESIKATDLAHQHEGLAALLKSNGVESVVVGGIGQGAADALEAYGIKLFAGASGDIAALATTFAAGQFVAKRVMCNHEGCGGGCGGHDEGHSHSHSGGCSCH